MKTTKLTPNTVLILLLLVSFLGCQSTPVSPGEGPGESIDLLIEGGTVLVLDEQLTVHSPGYVAIRDDRIVAVGAGDSGRRFQPQRRIDAAGEIVMPGIVNGHQHAPMVLFRGMGNDRNLMDWLNGTIFPAEAQNVNRDFVYWGTRLAALEMLRSGTTTYADMYYFEDEVARASVDAGIRVVAGQTVIGFPAPDHPKPEETLAWLETFIDEWKDHPLVIPAVAPHAPFTLSRQILEASKELADRKDVPLIIHVAETAAEVEQVKDEHDGLRAVEYLNRIGFLADRVTANHVVWAEPHEIEMLKQAEVGVIHNPESNMKLASGVAPVPAMLRAGIDLGLGTDGAASNNNLDMLQEMDSMAKLHKLVSNDPTVVTARETLFAATLGGARALNLQDRIGSLEEGKLADVIILSLNSPQGIPAADPYTTVVYSLLGDSVETVVVNGKILLDGYRFTATDEDQVYAESRRLITKVSASLSKDNR